MSKRSIPNPERKTVNNTRLPRNLAAADAVIDRGKAPSVQQDGVEFLHSLSPVQLASLRQATLRAHRKAVGPFGQADPTIDQLDTMICALGPQLAEQYLRKAVDEKRGEYDRGRHGHGLSDDSEFLRRAKKV